MLKAELIEKIRRACELHGGSLIERWHDGTISAELLEKAYEEIVEKNFPNRYQIRLPRWHRLVPSSVTKWR